MTYIPHSSNEPKLVRIEPEDRVVALARTLKASDPEVEAALVDNAANWARLGETYPGQALYRHRTVFHSASDAPVWSHLELSFFLTTPSSFILPRG